MNTIAITINLPADGTREDYLHWVSSALTAAKDRGDQASALALGGLLTLIDEGISFAEGGTPHFYFPKWGRTA